MNLKRDFEIVMGKLREKERTSPDPLLKKRRKMRNDMTEVLMRALLEERPKEGMTEEWVEEFMDRIAWAFANSASSIMATIWRRRDPKFIGEMFDKMGEELKRHAVSSAEDPTVNWLETPKPGTRP